MLEMFSKLLSYLQQYLPFTRLRSDYEHLQGAFARVSPQVDPLLLAISPLLLRLTESPPNPMGCKVLCLISQAEAKSIKADYLRKKASLTRGDAKFADKPYIAASDMPSDLAEENRL